MNKHYLMTKMKSTGTTYLCWFFGVQYAYLGKWGLQILYWVTFGGLTIWAFVDLFMIPSKVSKHNAIIANQIDSLEQKEKEDSHARNMAMMMAATGNRANS